MLIFRNSDSCRSSGSSRTERPRSRSPVKSHRSRPSHDSRGSPSHRAYSSSSSSSTSGSTRRTQRSRTPHVRPESDIPVAAAAGRNNDDPSLPSSRLFPGGIHHTPPRPDDSNTLLTTEQTFLQRPPPFLWSDPFRMDGDQLRRLLGGGGGESYDPDGALARLAHLDLMLRKSSLTLVPAGLGPPFRHLSSSPGFPGKAGIQSYFGMMPMTRYHHRAQIIDSPTSHMMYKITANGHHSELR